MFKPKVKKDFESLERRRLEALNLLRRGNSQSDVAKKFNVSRQAVHKWWKKYKTSGRAGVLHLSPPGPKPKLFPQELEELLRLLKKGAKDFGFLSDHWTTKRVAELIRKQFGVNYHFNHVGKILHKLGLSWKKPQGRAVERNERAIRKWIKETWPKIKKKPER